MIPVQPSRVAPVAAKRLNPLIEVDGMPQVLVMQFLASVPLNALGETAMSLADRHFEITDAIDFLLHGY